MTRIASRLRSRLVQRIYFVGILQFVIVVGGVMALVRAVRRPMFMADTLHFVAHEVAAQSTNPEALQGTVQRIYSDLHCAVAVHDRDGQLMAAAGELRRPSVGSDPAPFPGDLPPAGSVPIPLPGGGIGRLDYQMPMAPPPPFGLAPPVAFVLVVVGILSWLTARSLATPLARLTATANAFGAGDLTARASLGRSDELGDVARAFDEMAERVTTSIRAERELLANVSHELRTPLQRIRLALDLATDGDANTVQDSLKEITEDLAELEQLVEDVLSATRLSLLDGGPTSAVPPLRRGPIEARGLLEKAATRFRSAHPRRHLEASIAADAVLSGDAVLLRRVIDNLLDNAHKYSADPSTPVTLRSRVTDDALEIEVRDRGVGIAADDMPRVFEPFFRADRSRTRATGGVGLGLALAKRIVEAHGGRLSLESEPGQGTTARVTLQRVAGRSPNDP